MTIYYMASLTEPRGRHHVHHFKAYSSRVQALSLMRDLNTSENFGSRWYLAKGELVETRRSMVL